MPVRTSTPVITPTVTHKTKCPKCGKFKQSGRVSCCAPGGAWFKNCGSAGSRVDHRWFEGTEACKPKTTTVNSLCSKCGIIKKSGKISCCGRSGSWFGNCGASGNRKLEHTWREGIKVCKVRSQSETAIGVLRLNAAQQKGIDSSHGADKVTSKAVTTATKPFTFTSASTSTPMSVATPIVVSAESTSHAIPTSHKAVSTSKSHDIPTAYSKSITAAHTSASTSITTKGGKKLF